MNTKRAKEASLRGSPMATDEKQPASSESRIAPFAKSAAVELLQGQLKEHRNRQSLLAAQLKGVERSLDIEAATIEALETALIAIEQQPISANIGDERTRENNKL